MLYVIGSECVSEYAKILYTLHKIKEVFYEHFTRAHIIPIYVILWHNISDPINRHFKTKYLFEPKNEWLLPDEDIAQFPFRSKYVRHFISYLTIATTCNSSDLKLDCQNHINTNTEYWPFNILHVHLCSYQFQASKGDSYR